MIADSSAPDGALPLTRIPPGKKGTVAYLRPASPERLPELLALGFLPGESIEVVHTYPSYVFWIGHSQFAVDREMAAEIYVRVDAS